MEIVLIAFAIAAYYWGRPAWNAAGRAGNRFTNMFRSRVGRFVVKGCLLYIGFGILVGLCYAPLEMLGLVEKDDKDAISVVATVVFAACIVGLVLNKLRKWRRAHRIEQDALRARAESDRVRSAERVSNEEKSRRREALRSRCEAAYHTHGPEIAERFPRAAFDEYMKRYLGDNQPPEVAEERAEQLLAIIQSHLLKRDPPKVKPSLEGILATFDERRRKVEAAGLEHQDAEYLLSQLNELRDEAIRQAVLEGTL